MAKEHLRQCGLNDVFFHAHRMLREVDYSPDETASEIEDRIKSKVEKALRQEVTGEEDLETVTQRVHKLMEKLEHCS